MEAVTRLILLRHGETEWNACGKFQGHLDSPLTKKGVALAEAMAERLRSLSFTTLYSSDLGRAMHTARIFAAKTGHAIQIDPRLRERCLGIFQSFDRPKISELYPGEFESYLTGGVDYCVPDGESIAGRFQINLECLEELANRHAGETIAVVTHGGLVGVMFRYVVGLPLDAKRRFSLNNAAFNSFLRKPGGWFLETWGG